MAKLNTHVTVHDENGAPFTFGPDVELPEWAARKISNPNVWDGDAPVFEEEPEEEIDEADENEPARSGRGSGLPVWQAYAKSLDITFPEDADRNAIIALVDEHKAAAAK
jgi:hypothetical protein